MIRLLDLNPALDARELGRRFAESGRLQVRDLLTEESARNLLRVLAEQTPWGIAVKSGAGEPRALRQRDLQAMGRDQLVGQQQALYRTVGSGGYGFVFSQYPMLDAFQGGWDPGGPHEGILELVNDEPFLSFIREVTGMPKLVKADAQATLFGPGQFLATHDDSHRAEGWEVAYVLNLCAVDWRPDWGGYLNFYGPDGDVVEGFRPRFNALNLFRVPQPHSVSYVPPFAPIGRYAITGWFRDR